MRSEAVYKKLLKAAGWISEKFERADRNATERKKAELLKDEKKMLSESASADPAAELKRLIREEKRVGRNTKLFRITGVSAVRQVFFRPVVMPSIQAECEKWWFSLDSRRRSELAAELLPGNGIRERILRRTLELEDRRIPAEKTVSMEETAGSFTAGVKAGAVRYWPVLLMFAAMVFIYAVNISLQSGILALAGFVLCLFILWQCRFIKVKKNMGLKYFCPFAVLFVQSAYISEMAKKPDAGIKGRAKDGK